MDEFIDLPAGWFKELPNARFPAQQNFLDFMQFSEQVGAPSNGRSSIRPCSAFFYYVIHFKYDFTPWQLNFSQINADLNFTNWVYLMNRYYK